MVGAVRERMGKMAMGDTPYDEMLAQAWADFCDRLKAAPQVVFSDSAPATALDRATGFQYLTRQITRGLDEALEHADPLFPHLRWHMSPIRKYGGDNPDALYLRATIDGQHTYRLVGNRGSATWLAFSIHRRHPSVPLQQGQEIARVLGHELRTEWDGSFQLVLSPDQHAGNWLKTTPDTCHINIRQFFGDWVNERPMAIRLERMDMEGAPPPLEPELVAQGLRLAADMAVGNSAFWADWHRAHREHPNQFLDGSGSSRSLGGVTGGVGMPVYWKVQPDEVLLIEVTPPVCPFWNFEMNNYWMCSSDYRYHLCSVNSKQAVFEEDRSVRIAVAHADPGIPNWLDTAGHCEGHIGLRWQRADSAPVPRTRLVRLADLPSLLPLNARRITPAERREQLRYRKIGVDRRFRT